MGTAVFKVGILETHPIQYKVPWFRALHEHPDIDLTVFFCMIPDAAQQGRGFGVDFEWDIPLLDGYNYRVLENVARDPGTSHFFGCDTPGIYPIVAGGTDVESGQLAGPANVGSKVESGTSGRQTRDETNNYQRSTNNCRSWSAFIVNGWVVKSCLQTLLACRRAGVPCVVRGESNALRPRPWWKGTCHRALMSQYSAFLSIGQSNRQFYRQNGVPDEKIFHAPYCVENERFERAAKKAQKRRQELRRQWDIPEEATCFMFCGKFEPKKRPMDLLRALHHLRCRPTNNFLPSSRNQPPTVNSELSTTNSQLSTINSKSVHLLMVGDGDLRSRCEQYVDAKDLPVTFAGFLNQSELPAAYAASDCLVLPSDYGETWGLVVNEAMACGLPAIVSDRVGCYPDLIAPGRTGEVFGFGEIEELADKMQQQLDGSGRLATMGEAAKKRVNAYDISTLVQGTVEAIKYLNSFTVSDSFTEIKSRTVVG